MLEELNIMGNVVVVAIAEAVEVVIALMVIAGIFGLITYLWLKRSG